MLGCSMRFVEFFDKLPSVKAKALLVVRLLVVGRVVEGSVRGRYSSVGHYSENNVHVDIISWRVRPQSSLVKGPPHDLPILFRA